MFYYSEQVSSIADNVQWHNYYYRDDCKRCMNSDNQSVLQPHRVSTMIQSDRPSGQNVKQLGIFKEFYILLAGHTGKYLCLHKNCKLHNISQMFSAVIINNKNINLVLWHCHRFSPHEMWNTNTKVRASNTQVSIFACPVLHVLQIRKITVVIVKWKYTIVIRRHEANTMKIVQTLTWNPWKILSTGIARSTRTLEIHEQTASMVCL